MEQTLLWIRREQRLQWFLKNHPDCILSVKNVWHTATDLNTPPIRFYLPDALDDAVQGDIALHNNFFDLNTIEAANPFFPDGANILDIGANIGNNALYYACVRRAKKVIAFEPMADVFAILQKNVQLNNLENTVFPQNFALGEKAGNASVLSRPLFNLGGSEIKADEKGALKIQSLDELEAQNFFTDKIDFIKIDVEGFETPLLKGARSFLARHKPAIQIESHTAKYAEMAEEMQRLAYVEKTQIGGADYIYLPQ